MSDFEKKREHLKSLSDAELKQRFWEMADKVTKPLVDFASKYTSPSIERSVLLRMGFSSMQSDAIVKKVFEAGMLGKGAGHAVIKVMEKFDLDAMNAGNRIIEDEALDIASLF